MDMTDIKTKFNFLMLMYKVLKMPEEMTFTTTNGYSKYASLYIQRKIEEAMFGAGITGSQYWYEEDAVGLKSLSEQISDEK